MILSNFRGNFFFTNFPYHLVGHGFDPLAMGEKIFFSSKMAAKSFSRDYERLLKKRKKNFNEKFFFLLRGGPKEFLKILMKKFFFPKVV